MIFFSFTASILTLAVVSPDLREIEGLCAKNLLHQPSLTQLALSTPFSLATASAMCLTSFLILSYPTSVDERR